MGQIVCWVLAGGFGLFAAGRAAGLEHTWYLVALVSFTPYLALASLLPLGVALALREWRAAGLAGLACLVLALLVMPRGFGGPDPGPGPRLSVMSTNMKYGGADPATTVGLVRAHRVDVLAVEEYTADAEHALDAAGLSELLPYSQRDPIAASALGSAIYSRYPLSDVGVTRLPLGYNQAYATVHVPGAQPLLVVAVHSTAPNIPADNPGWWRSLGEQVRATPDGPVRLLIGDFNATLDHVALRRLLSSGYRDIADVLGEGFTPTWPYDGRTLPPITLDHVLADRRIGAVSFGATVVPGTDHKAIYATLTLPGADA